MPGQAEHEVLRAGPQQSGHLWRLREIGEQAEDLCVYRHFSVPLSQLQAGRSAPCRLVNERSYHRELAIAPEHDAGDAGDKVLRSGK